MKIKEYKELIEAVIFIAVAVFPALGLPITDSMKAIFVVSIAVIYILFKTGQLMYKRFFQERSMSKVKTILTAGRYAKTINKFTNVIDKKISKKKEFNQLNKLKNTEKKVLYALKDPHKMTKKQNELKEKLNHINLKFEDKEIISLMKKTEVDSDYMIAHQISKLLVDFERTLLHAEQYEYRIKFGEFITKYALDENDRQRAFIDSIGWTYLMTGHVEKGEKAIQAGINRALNVVKETENKKVKNESLFNLARAYRHLGSNRYTNENYPEKAIEYLEKAALYTKDINMDSLITKEQPLDKVERRILEMNIGIDYGMIIARYHQFNQRSKKQSLSEVDYENFYHAYLSLKDLKIKTFEFSNKHRFVKTEVLITKFIEVIHDHYQQFSNICKAHVMPSLKELEVEFKETLHQADNVFKENIFADEAVESYLEQKVVEMKYNILQILKGVV